MAWVSCSWCTPSFARSRARTEFEESRAAATEGLGAGPESGVGRSSSSAWTTWLATSGELEYVLYGAFRSFVNSRRAWRSASCGRSAVEK